MQLPAALTGEEKTFPPSEVTVCKWNMIFQALRTLNGFRNAKTFRKERLTAERGSTYSL